MIRVNCPACGREFEFSDSLGGLTVVCKNCSHPIPVLVSRQKMPPASEAITAASGVTLTPPTPAAPLILPEARPLADSPFDSTPLPEWAIERARALLRTGVRVPQIEQRLVAQGLSPETATAVVDRLLKDRTRQQVGPLEQDDRRNRWHRLLSGVVGCGCVFLAYWFFGTWSACRTGIALLLPGACIWFPDEMGVYASKYSFTVTSLGVLIRWCGWLVLVLIGLRVLWLGLALTSG